MTEAQRAAYMWLKRRGGDGAFIRGGQTVIAHGDIAKCTRATWNALQKAGKVEYYAGAKQGGSGYGRLRIIGCID